MGRGGKKNKKQTGNTDPETQGSRDPELPSTSTQTDVPTSDEPKPAHSIQSEQVSDPTKVKEEPKIVETSQEEPVGLGLDLGESKKKPRRKKKNVPEAQQVPLKSAVSEPVAKKNVPEAQQVPLKSAVSEPVAKSLPVQAQEATQLKPVDSQPTTPSLPGNTEAFPGLAGRGRGRGRGAPSAWGAPQQPMQQIHSQQPMQLIHAQQPMQQIHSQQPMQLIHAQQPMQQIHSQQPMQQIHSQQPMQLIHAQQPMQQIHSQQPMQLIHAQQPMQQIHSQQPMQQIHAQQRPGQQPPGQQPPGQQRPGQQRPGQQRPGQQRPGQQPPGQQRPAQQLPQSTTIPQLSTSLAQLSTSDRSSSGASSSSTKSYEGAICRFKIPAKIDGGTVPAKRLQVLTNYLEMKIKDIKVYRYDVSIKPDRPKKLTPKAFAVAKANNFPKSVIAYDQRKNCYSLSPLWDPSKERMIYNVEIFDDNKVKMPFEVTLKATGIVDLATITNHIKTGGSSLNTPSEAIQCIDVILQQGTLENYVKVGRQFFKRPSNPIDLGFGLEMWTGLFQSAIFTWRPFINIDVAHKGFPRGQTLLNALQKDFQLKPNQALESQRSFNIELFHQFIKGLRVKAYVGGDSRGGKLREYICNELVAPANKLTFVMEQNGKTTKMTVEQYFLSEKKLRLQYPNLNCMWVGPKNKNIYYPIELLEISYGQALNKQLNERQLQTMVKEAATPPNDRLNKIKEVIRDMNYSANPMFKHFKLEIANEFFRVDAKVLEAPKINVGTGRSVAPRNGAWMANRFLKPSALESWGLIAVDADPNACRCEDLIENIKRVSKQMGMSANNPKYFNFNVRALDLKKTLCAAMDKGVNFMFIIVGGRDRNCYHKVKRIAELEVGMLTQCIKEFTAKVRMNDQTVRNILLKVNSKLNGVNQALDLSSVPKCIREGGVMMVGADVTHPSPDQVSVPSIAAVTASFDDQCFMYNIELSVQTPKAEIIVDFEEMMFDHLNVYRKHRRCLPRKIYVFRDGVSEGQFSQVMNSELVAIQSAYARLDRQRKPEILFLLVQKRHHTRFFLGERERQNVEPGTVVDTEIVHRSELDFYLVSHAAIKGTARPTRYHAVANDGRVPSDEVEQLTYYLCHLYSRCTRSVSYPTPTYYAHLACLRARSLTFGDTFNNSDLEKKPKRLRVMDKILDCSRMFFV